MWLISMQGMYSVVEHREDPQRMLVRCRARGDLIALAAQIPGLEGRVFYDDQADYPWRAEVSRSEWALAAARLATEVDYDNFKDAVARAQGHKRAHVYHDVWNALLKLEVTDHWDRIYGPWEAELRLELPEVRMEDSRPRRRRGKGRKKRVRARKGGRS